MAEKTLATGKQKRDKYATGWDYLVLNGPMDENAVGDVYQAVPSGKKHNKLVLIPVTYGGSANSAYRIGRALQDLYEDIAAFIPSYCKSAGTLLVTACNTIIISPFGDLGPLDVQLPQRDEILGTRSGLTTRSAMADLKVHAYELFEHFLIQTLVKSEGNITYKTAAELSEKVTAELMGKLYQQVSPDVLGKELRDLNVATEYCQRLNRRFGNVKRQAIKRLVHDYPAHDFVIDHDEAKTLFERVEFPPNSLMEIMKSRTPDCMVPRVDDHVVEFVSSPVVEPDTQEFDGENHEKAR